jgi:tetratricopeptide (TPR) repeat protein
VTSFHMPFLPPEALADEGSIAIAAHRAIALAKGGETRAALNLALQARRRAQGLELGVGEIEALSAAAIVHIIRGDAIAAVATAIDACGLARRSGRATLHPHALVSLKLAASSLGACDDPVRALQACVSEAIACGDAPVEIRARVGLGVVFGDAGRFDAAQYEFVRALQLAERHPDTTGPSRITANIANLHRKRALAHLAAGFEARGLHECDAAARVAGRACRMAVEERNVAAEIDALAIRGCAHDLRGERERAQALLRASIALGQASRCPSAIVWVLCELGRMCLAADDLAGARGAFLEALELARELRPSRKIAVACAGLADVLAREGDVPATLAWRERAADETAAFEIASLQTRRQIREFFAA